MKPFLFGLAVSILFILFFVYQKENNKLIQELKIVKYMADECAASASLYYDIDKYGSGNFIYNQQEGNKAIETVLSKGNKKYWESTTYEVFYFDNDSVSFPYTFKDPYRDYIKIITEPTVIVILKVYKDHLRLAYMRDRIFFINSAYENLDY